MTMKDIAKKAGVSISTVSRVINGKDKSASKEVKERIMNIVKQSGFSPNVSAQRLKTPINQSHQTIHILYARVSNERTNDFFDELTTFIEKEILANGFKIGKHFYHKELNNKITHFMPNKHDGLIVLGRSNGEPSYFFNRFFGNVVHITLNQMKVNSDHVMSDGKMATEIAINYLISQGHRKIAYIGEPYNEIRYKAFRNLMLLSKLELPRNYIIDSQMTAEGGERSVNALLKLKEMPTAVFCANDATAIGVLKGLKKHNINVPEDISIISIDNIKEAEKCEPLLTTVKIPLEELAYIGVKTLHDRINNGHRIKLITNMPSELVIRNSVKKIIRY